MKQSIMILVPVYDEGKVFERWLQGLLPVACELEAQVVVIDDGSRIPVKVPEEVVLLRHEVNCGVGAAIGTGLRYARSKSADIVLTIDGDGQHDPRDLLPLTSALRAGEGDIVNGSRFLKPQAIPFSRRVANFLGNIITWMLSGIWVSDSQSGMKGFAGKGLEKLEIMTAGYEWCTDIFREANWHDLKVREVPISVLYNSYTLNKGQNFAVGVDMVVRLAVRSLFR